MSLTNFPIDQRWLIMTADEPKILYFYWDFSSRRQVSYHTSVLFSAELGLTMRIYTSFPDYTVCHSISCYHRGSQSLSHSLWFISPTCFASTHCDHCWETQPLHRICFPLHVYAFVSICDMSCRSVSTQTPGWESGGLRRWLRSSKLAWPTNTTLHWPKIR